MYTRVHICINYWWLLVSARSGDLYLRAHLWGVTHTYTQTWLPETKQLNLSSISGALCSFICVLLQYPSLWLFSFVLLPTHIFHFYPSYFQRNESLILTAGLFLELLILQFYLCLESTSYNYDFRFVAIWWFFPYNSFFAGEFWFSFFYMIFLGHPLEPLWNLWHHRVQQKPRLFFPTRLLL